MFLFLESELLFNNGGQISTECVPEFRSVAGVESSLDMPVGQTGLRTPVIEGTLASHNRYYYAMPGAAKEIEKLARVPSWFAHVASCLLGPSGSMP